MTETIGGAVGDGELWRRATENDPRAFGALFDRHADAVYTHCFRRTASWSDAQDLTSAVFLEAWRRRREVRLAGESILPWLLAVANNATRNRDRAMRRHRRLLAKLPPPEAVPDVAEAAAARLDDERRMRRVLRAFDQLSPPEQDVLALCVWAALPYTDVAVAIGVPVGTVRSRLARARSRLREFADTADPDAAERRGPHADRIGPTTIRLENSHD